GGCRAAAASSRPPGGLSGVRPRPLSVSGSRVRGRAREGPPPASAPPPPPVAAVAPVPAPVAVAAVTVTAIAAVPVTAIAAVTVATIPVTAVPVTAAEVLAGRLALDHLDRHQRQLAAVVDLADLDLDLVADLDDVIHVLDPHAAMQLADLGDVQQAVLTRQQRNEGAERGRLHHRAKEPLAHLGDVRVRDRVDGRPRGLCR